MSKVTSIAFAFGVLSLGAVTLSVAPAAAQDRTPPAEDLRSEVPTIDLRPGQIFQTQHDMYRVREGRSVYRDSAAPDVHDVGAQFDR